MCESKKKCAGNHDIMDCKATISKCANCIQANKKLNLNLKTNHTAGSKACKVLDRKVSLSKKRVQYKGASI